MRLRTNLFPMSLAAAAVLLAAGSAHAQALRCAVPARVAAPRADLPTADQPRRLLPIGGYTLALTWSPGYCRGKAADASNRFQCGGENRFGFTLHGLWPDGRGTEWPQYCRPAAILPAAVVAANLCATPSQQLLQHEWAKHGTCMSDRPADYFARSRALYERLRFPDMARLSRGPLTVGGLSAAMARANPGLRADMMVVTATRGGWLDELWLCLDTRFRPRRCPVHQGGKPPREALRIWRGER